AAASEPSLEVVGSSPISRLSPLGTFALNQGPFPPPALPGFVGTTDLSDSPGGPACPSRASGWPSRGPPPGVSRVAPDLPVQACRRPYPGGNAGSPVARLSAASAAFPTPLLGRLPHFLFRGLLGVHACYGLPARGVARATLSIG